MEKERWRDRDFFVIKRHVVLLNSNLKNTLPNGLHSLWITLSNNLTFAIANR